MTAAPDWHALAADPAHIEYAAALAGRWARRLPRQRDDIVSAALWGLVDAARTHDPARGARFRTLLYVRVVGAVRDTLRMSLPAGYRRDARGRGAADRTGMPGTVRGAGPVASGDLPVGWELEAEDSFRRLVRGLPPQYRRALTLHYLYGLPTAEVARRMGCCVQNVKVTLVKARRLLRAELGDPA